MSAPTIRELGQQYIAYAVNEPGRSGRPRSATTMSSFRRAVEGFATAAEALGVQRLDQLPESFIENEWMQTQQSVLTQPIQLRVRISAVRRFTQWAQQQGIPCTTFRFPEVQTPAAKETPEMSDMSYLTDPAQPDPVPSSTPTQTVAMPTAVPPPAPQQRQPQQKAGRHPLAHMFPTPGARIRVRKERDLGQDPVWMGDYPADRVAAFGAIEPFLGREVGTRLAQAGVTGDVSLLVTSLTAKGEELETTRITIAIPPLATAPVQSIPAPVVGAPVVVPVPSGSPAEQVAEVVAAGRRAQEELEERLMRRLRQEQEAKAQPQAEERRPQNDEMSEMRNMMSTLASAVQSLAQRMEDREERVMTRAEPPPAAPQLDMLGIFREMMTMAKPAPVAPPPGPEQMLGLMAQMKTLFAPANVNIDVSPLEERIDLLQKQVAQKPKGVAEMVSEFKALKELFTVVGGETSAPKPTGLGAALGNFITKVADNPEPFMLGVERVVSAARSGGQSQQPVAQQQPVQLTQEAQQLRALTKTLLDASGPDAVLVAAHEWMRALMSNPQTTKIAERISDLVRKSAQGPLAVYLQQVLKHLGFQLPPERVAKLSEELLAGIKAANATASKDEEGDEGDEGDEDDEDEDEEGVITEGQPDLTVRVGGVEHDEGEEEGDEGEEEQGEEEPSDEEEQPEEEPEEEQAIEAADEERVVEPPPAETKSQRRKRRKAEREAAETDEQAEA